MILTIIGILLIVLDIKIVEKKGRPSGIIFLGMIVTFIGLTVPIKYSEETLVYEVELKNMKDTNQPCYVVYSEENEKYKMICRNYNLVDIQKKPFLTNDKEVELSLRNVEVNYGEDILPILKKYEMKGKETIWTFGISGKKVSYVIYLPKDTIMYE